MRIRNLNPLSSLLLFLLILINMAESTGSPSSEATIQIVYTEQPQDERPEDYHIRVLSAVLGSEEAAREALLYSYKNAATGFSAKLTPEQVVEISKQPGVVQVVPSRTLQLHSGPGRLQ
ncbi:subtilisin-like protease SBT3.17 [Carica papaya]|uniref:subtilisin-like protease SBT3.17 n=1 Tax=Carica papaya TaxID=3649 RepID=UPI000B8D1809|nr:subtilisin-like protease SBT3.17 [Carica papaya]